MQVVQEVELEHAIQPVLHAEHFPLLTNYPDLHVVQLPVDEQAEQFIGQVTVHVPVDVTL